MANRKATRLEPGDTIGVLGSGQLGRMLAMAAARLGLKTHIYCPESGPAFDVAAARTIAAYDDDAALSAFAAKVKVVTYEFENVPSHTAEFLAARLPVHPNAFALATAQDRFAEKTFINGLGIATAPFAAVDTVGDLRAALAALGHPAILKTRRMGYDGKGQIMIRDGDDPAAAFATIGEQPAILEGLVPFVSEVSVVAARSVDGAFAAFDLNQNEHADHILSVTFAPASVAPATATRAFEIARAIADALDYVGVIAVELFVVIDHGVERLIVNEIAPRVHNSGHWTIDGAECSQFEQHVRAVSGWPLGSPRIRGRIEMRNLIGDEALDWPAILAEPGAYLHLYGKHEARAGRKMGHVTRVFKTITRD
jgi:5-(carboxyamino)imidazole ribonucleotide synthase